MGFLMRCSEINEQKNIKFGSCAVNSNIEAVSKEEIQFWKRGMYQLLVYFHSEDSALLYLSALLR